MKLIASGVTFSAAIVRSPSFSRSSSSTTMIIRPARSSAIASSIDANGPRLRAPLAIRIFECLLVILESRRPLRAHQLQGPSDVLADHVALQIHLGSNLQGRQARVGPGEWNDHDIELVTVQ